MKLLSFLTLALLPLLAPCVHAAVLVQYTFTGSSLNPAVEDPDADASAFAFGAGLPLPPNGISTEAGNPLPSIYIRSSTTTEPVSPTSTDYVGFSITAGAGLVLNLTSLAFDYVYNGNGGSLGQSATFNIRSSVDGFTTNLGSYVKPWEATNTFTLTNPAVNLSTLTGLSNVEFRIYLTDTLNSATAYLRMDNVTLYGEVIPIPVPEPGTVALAALGLLALGAGRRKISQAGR